MISHPDAMMKTCRFVVGLLSDNKHTHCLYLSVCLQHSGTAGDTPAKCTAPLFTTCICYHLPAKPYPSFVLLLKRDMMNDMLQTLCVFTRDVLLLYTVQCYY